MAASNLTWATNSTENVSSGRPKYLDTVPFGVISIPLELLGTVGSLVFLIELHHNHQYRTSATTMFINLCVATLVQIGVICPLQTYTYITGTPNIFSGPTGWPYCQVQALVYMISVHAVILCQAAIALNRLCLVVFVHKHAGLKSRTVTGIFLALPWVLPFIVYLFPLFGIGGAYGYNFYTNKCSFVRRETGFSAVARHFITFASFLVMFLSYTIIFFKMSFVQHRFLINTSLTQIGPLDSMMRNGVVGNPRALRQMRREIRAAKIALVSCSSFVVCFLPTAIQGFVTRNNTDRMLSSLGLSLLMIQSLGIAISPWLACFLYGEYDNKLSRDFLKWLDAGFAGNLAGGRTTTNVELECSTVLYPNIIPSTSKRINFKLF